MNEDDFPLRISKEQTPNEKLRRLKQLAAKMVNREATLLESEEYSSLKRELNLTVDDVVDLIKQKKESAR